MTLTRREFVARTSLATMGALAVPRHVLGRGFQASGDTLRIAAIGCGGRGRDNLRGVASERIVALCDVDLRNAEAAARAYPGARIYQDFRAMLDRQGRDIDAVVISTPDHTHAVAAAAAMRLGKHVFCDKPLTRTVGETRALMELARRSGVVTQMGNQGHAGAGLRELRELIEAGAIGTVREIHYWTNRPIWPQGIERPLEAYNVPPWLDWDLWLGPAPYRPYAPAYVPFRWRGWWDFGTGALGDMACHTLNMPFFALNLRNPTSVVAETAGHNKETFPTWSVIEFQFPEIDGRPALKLVWYDGGKLPPDEDRLPKRFFEMPIGEGPGAGGCLHEGTLRERIRAYNLARGWSLLLAGAFGLVCLFGARRPFFPRALTALTVAFALAFAMTGLGPLSGAQIREAVSTEFGRRNAESMATMRQILANYSGEWEKLASRMPPAAREPAEIERQLRTLSDAGVQVFPALLALESLAALALAWSM
jgi:predicted dehydrogenase